MPGCYFLCGALALLGRALWVLVGLIETEPELSTVGMRLVTDGKRVVCALLRPHLKALSSGGQRSQPRPGRQERPGRTGISLV